MSNETAQLLGNLPRGKVFVMSAPSGTGKNTLLARLLDEFSCVVESISCTTRTPREGEEDGDHYHFLSREDFEQRLEEGHFLEHVQLYGNYYGTSRATVEKQLEAGKHVVLVIDTGGAIQLMDKLDGVFIFVRPPSLEALAARLRGRKTEKEDAIETRLGIVEEELRAADRYDYVVVNDDLNIAYEVLRSIFIAEEHRSEGPRRKQS